MKKTIVVGSMVLALITGTAFAMGSSSEHGAMHGGQMSGSMDACSTNHGCMDHESMNSGSMDHSSMDGQNIQQDHDRMTQDGLIDQNGTIEAHQHQ